MATRAHVSAHIWLCAVHTTLRPLSLTHMRAPVRAHPGKSYYGNYPLCDAGGSHSIGYARLRRRQNLFKFAPWTHRRGGRRFLVRISSELKVLKI